VRVVPESVQVEVARHAVEVVTAALDLVPAEDDVLEGHDAKA